MSNIDIFLFKVSKLLILYKFSDISFEISLQKYFEVIDVNLFIDYLNNLLENWLSERVLKLG